MPILVLHPEHSSMQSGRQCSKVRRHGTAQAAGRFAAYPCDSCVLGDVLQ